MLLCASLIVLISHFLRRRNRAEQPATTPLVDLLHQMEQQRLTGDFSRVVEVAPDTEVGQIALQYNRVVQRAQDEIRSREAVVAALRSTEEKYRCIFENAVEGIFQTTPDGQYLSANPTLARIYGYENVADMQKAIRDIQHQLYVDPRRRFEFAQQIKTAGVVRCFESQVFRADGQVIWISENARVVRDEQGELRYYEGTVEDISERKHAEELVRQKEAALASSSAKSEFLARMSHEIRTPLNGVIGMLELLQGTHLSQQQQRYARVAKNSADTLLTLVNDILDFSKIEAGKLELDHTNFDLHGLLEDTAELFAERAAEKGLELVCHLSPSLPRAVNSDPDRLRQIVVNLLNNAIKFTARGQVVLHAAIVTNGNALAGNRVSVRFCVEDTGIGIPADRVDRLFQSFSQVDVSTTRKYGGTGLGLAICRELVALFGGELGVHSTVNQGSKFWFSVPVGIQAQVDQRRRELPRNLASVRVLAVDDNRTNRELLHEQFESWGLSIESVCNGREALERLALGASQQRAFQLVLLDFNMPGMDGLELARAIRINPDFQDAKLVMLSSSGTLFDDPRLARSGLSACLPKPVRQSKLFDTVIELFAPRKKNTPAPAAKPAPKLQPAKRNAKILVAEDNEVNQQVVSEILAAAGFGCQLVSNGRWAFDEVERHVYDLVLMDCQMPEMDGFETTRAIRRKETDQGEGKHLPIIALTANAVQGDRERCLAAGMDAYVTKPIHPATLIGAIESLLAQLDPTNEAAATTDSAEPAEQATETEATTDELAAPGLPTIDLKPLRARCLNDDSFLQRVLGKALTRIPADVLSIVTAAERVDYEALARSAHALAGMSANLEAQQLLLAARRLEEVARQQQAEELPTLLVQLRQAANNTERAVEELNEQLNATVGP